MPLIDPAIREIYDSLVTTHADSPGYEKFRDTWFEIVWAAGAHEKEGEVLMDLKALPSGQTTVRRADFLDALVGLVPREIVHFGKRLERLVEVETGDGVELVFEDGECVRADVVVGCDGIRSKVKESMLPEESERTQPRYSGMYGYRAVLDMEDMIDAVGEQRARVSTMYLGYGAYGISYPIMRARKVNVGLYILSEKWDCETWVRPAKREDMQRDASNMGRYVQALVEVCLRLRVYTIVRWPSSLTNVQRMPDPSQWAIFEHPPISTFCRSRVAVLGDAAHASTPHQGAGAGQAIEDAHVLAELLGDSRVQKAGDVVAVFKAYDEIRRPRSQRVVTSSKENAHLLCLCLDGVGDDEVKLKETFQSRLRWLWDLDMEAQAERAKKSMHRILDSGGDNPV